MSIFHSYAAVLLALGLSLTPSVVPAQVVPTPSAVIKPPTPIWESQVRYGGGPSIGAPPSDYTGARRPAQWCLKPDGRATGDFGISGGSWRQASRYWLRHILTDTTDFGGTWRRVLGGAPLLASTDSIIEITDEATCRTIAKTLNRDLLGWRVGPPPVVVFRIRDYLVAYPSNAHRGEFGLAAGMTVDREIRGVATW